MRNPTTVAELVEGVELVEAAQQPGCWERALPFPRRVVQGATRARGHLTTSSQAGGSHSNGRTHANSGPYISRTDVAGRLYCASRPTRGSSRSGGEDQWPPIPSPSGLRQCGHPGTFPHPRTPRRNQGYPSDHLRARRHAPRPGPESNHLSWPRRVGRWKWAWYRICRSPSLLGEIGQGLTVCLLPPYGLSAQKGAAAGKGRRREPVVVPPSWPRTAGEMVSPLNITLTSTMTYSNR